MKVIRILAMIVVGPLAIAACADTTGDIEDAVTSLPEASDVADLAGEVQAEMTELATEIQNSQAAADLETAWVALQAEMTAALSSVQADGEIDTTALQSELDEFESELTAAGDEVGDDLMSAWSSLRAKFEDLIS
jgi:formiminotetrahydrofolate cyclodeaminase